MDKMLTKINIHVLTPKAVDRKEREISRRWWISIRKTQLLISLRILISDISRIIISSQFSSFKATNGVSPCLERTVHEAAIKPGGDLVELHTRVVGVVPSLEVVTVSEEGDDPVATAVAIVEGVALWNGNEFVFRDTALPLSIKDFLYNLLT